MKKNLSIHRVICSLLCLHLFCLPACKRECDDERNPDCENYNPCAGSLPTSADFMVEESPLREFNQLAKTTLSCDTVLTINDVFFTARQDFSSYDWSMLEDANFKRNTRSFRIWFLKPGSFHLRLIGRRAASACLPGDDGVDTVIRKILVLDGKYNQILGRWWGANQSSPADTFSLYAKITDSTDYGGGNWEYQTKLINLMGDAESKIPVRGYKSFTYEGGLLLHNRKYFIPGKCKGYIQGDRMIFVYLLQDKAGHEALQTFIGTRQ